MKKLMLLSTILLGFLHAAVAQQSDAGRQVMAMFNLTNEELAKVAPHCPKLSDFTSHEKNYTKHLVEWSKKYESEFVALGNLPEVMEKNFAWESLGMKNPIAPKVNYHPISQAIEALPSTRMAQIMPHFPSIKTIQLTGNLENDRAAYAKAIDQWIESYPGEYTAFLNAPEIIALKHVSARNPVRYEGRDSKPAFMAFTDIDMNEPTLFDTGNSELDHYNHKMRLQHWYFVFKPGMYVQLFGGLPKLPEGFDLEKYRESFKTKSVEAPK